MSQDEEVLEQNANTHDDVEDGEIIEQSNDPMPDDESSDEGEDESQEVEATATETKERPVYTMPVQKAQEEKRRAVERAKEEARRESEAEVQRIKAEYEAKLSASSKGDEFNEELRKVSDEYGLDPKAAQGLLNVFKKSLPIDKYEAIIKKQEIEGHKAQVSADFDAKVTPLILKDYPQASPEHIRQVKERVAELAFSQGYNAYPLEHIYKLERDEFEFKNGYSAEPSGGRSSELVDFSKMTDDDENELAKRDPAAFAKYVKWQDSQDSKFLD